METATVRSVNEEIASLKRQREEITRKIECLGHKRMRLAVPDAERRRVRASTFRRLAVEDRAHCWRKLSFVDAYSQHFKDAIERADTEPRGLSDLLGHHVFECEGFKRNTCHYTRDMTDASRATQISP